MEVENVQAEENVQTPAPKKGSKVARFFLDILRGFAIGIAFIIPGFSGGSIAAILGIYERLVGAIADIFKSFKQSVITLLPIAIGMVLGVAALIVPIQWGLQNYPIPTVTLFVGMAIGGLPSITDKVKDKKPSWQNLVIGVVAAVVAVAFALPAFFEFADKDLFNLSVGGYFVLLLVGLIGSAALVVPGISGSMLLLVLGYYNPIVDMILHHFLRGQNMGVSILVLGCVGVGIIIGFFLISILMKFLLKKYPRATYFAILGFIVGSIPAVYMSTVSEMTQPLFSAFSNPWYWVVSVLFLLVGFALSFSLVLFAKKREKNEKVKVTVLDGSAEK